MPRRILYGYTLLHGRMCIDPLSAKVVEHIYVDYNNGRTQKQIMNDLILNKVKPPSIKSNWTQAKIRTILTNSKYMGDDYHPKIIKEVDFYDAQKHRERTNDGIKKSMQKTEIGNCYRKKIICGKCGRPYIKKKMSMNSSKGKVQHRWFCKSCEESYTYFVEEAQVDEGFIKVFNCIKTDLSKLDIYEELKGTNFTINKLDVIINQNIRSGSLNIDDFNELLLQRAQEVYNITPSCEHVISTKKLKDKVTKTKIQTEFSEKLFLELVDRIICEKNKLTYVFANGKRMSISCEYKQRKGDRGNDR